MTKTAFRLCGGVVLGLLVVTACAASVAPATNGGAESAEELARKGDAGVSPSPSAAPSSDDDAGPRCPYGVLEDPHRGFIRCLMPDERDAGWLPPPAQPGPPAVEAPDAGKDPGKPGPAGPPPVVEVGSPKFENGEVPRVEKALNGMTNDIAKCVAENGGLSAPTATMKIQFLVRARGRAEGVGVSVPKGVSPEAQSCVRLLLKNKAIGAPTADPVGVTVTLTLKPGPAK